MCARCRRCTWPAQRYVYLGRSYSGVVWHSHKLLGSVGATAALCLLQEQLWCSHYHLQQISTAPTIASSRPSPSRALSGSPALLPLPQPPSLPPPPMSTASSLSSCLLISLAKSSVQLSSRVLCTATAVVCPDLGSLESACLMLCHKPTVKLLVKGLASEAVCPVPESLYDACSNEYVSKPLPNELPHLAGIQVRLTMHCVSMLKFEPWHALRQGTQHIDAA